MSQENAHDVTTWRLFIRDFPGDVFVFQMESKEEMNAVLHQLQAIHSDTGRTIYLRLYGNSEGYNKHEGIEGPHWHALSDNLGTVDMFPDNPPLHFLSEDEKKIPIVELIERFKKK